MSQVFPTLWEHLYCHDHPRAWRDLPLLESNASHNLSEPTPSHTGNKGDLSYLIFMWFSSHTEHSVFNSQTNKQKCTVSEDTMWLNSSYARQSTLGSILGCEVTHSVRFSISWASSENDGLLLVSFIMIKAIRSPCLPHQANYDTLISVI